MNLYTFEILLPYLLSTETISPLVVVHTELKLFQRDIQRRRCIDSCVFIAVCWEIDFRHQRFDCKSLQT